MPSMTTLQIGELYSLVVTLHCFQKSMLSSFPDDDCPRSFCLDTTDASPCQYSLWSGMVDDMPEQAAAIHGIDRKVMCRAVR